MQKLRQLINRIISPYQAQIWNNGKFEIHNVKEGDKFILMNKLKRSPLILDVNAYQNGKYDFSNMMNYIMGNPKQYYTIYGNIDISQNKLGENMSKKQLIEYSNTKLVEQSITDTCITEAAGYTWFGDPVEVRDYAQDLVTTEDVILSDVSGNHETFDNPDEMMATDIYDEESDEVTIPEGTTLAFVGMDRNGTFGVAVYQLPYEYNYVEIRIYFDYWKDVLQYQVKPLEGDWEEASDESNEGEEDCIYEVNDADVIFGEFDNQDDAYDLAEKTAQTFDARVKGKDILIYCCKNGTNEWEKIDTIDVEPLNPNSLEDIIQWISTYYEVTEDEMHKMKNKSAKELISIMKQEDPDMYSEFKGDFARSGMLEESIKFKTKYLNESEAMVLNKLKENLRKNQIQEIVNDIVDRMDSNLKDANDETTDIEFEISTTSEKELNKIFRLLDDICSDKYIDYEIEVEETYPDSEGKYYYAILNRKYPDDYYFDYEDDETFWATQPGQRTGKYKDMENENMNLKESSDGEQKLAVNARGDYLVNAASGHGYTVFNQHDVAIGGFDGDDDDRAISRFKMGDINEKLNEFLGFGKKKAKKNLYVIAMVYDSSGRLFTSEVWREIEDILRNNLDRSRIDTDSNRNYFRYGVLHQCEFTATEDEFRSVKSDVDYFLSRLNNKPEFFAGYDYVNGKGEPNPDIKESASRLVKFECIEQDIKESLDEAYVYPMKGIDWNEAPIHGPDISSKASAEWEKFLKKYKLPDTTLHPSENGNWYADAKNSDERGASSLSLLATPEAHKLFLELLKLDSITDFRLRDNKEEGLNDKWQPIFDFVVSELNSTVTIGVKGISGDKFKVDVWGTILSGNIKTATLNSKQIISLVNALRQTNGDDDMSKIQRIVKQHFDITFSKGGGLMPYTNKNTAAYDKEFHNKMELRKASKHNSDKVTASDNLDRVYDRYGYKESLKEDYVYPMKGIDWNDAPIYSPDMSSKDSIDWEKFLKKYNLPENTPHPSDYNWYADCKSSSDRNASSLSLLATPEGVKLFNELIKLKDIEDFRLRDEIGKGLNDDYQPMFDFVVDDLHSGVTIGVKGVTGDKFKVDVWGHVVSGDIKTATLNSKQIKSLIDNLHTITDRDDLAGIQDIIERYFDVEYSKGGGFMPYTTPATAASDREFHNKMELRKNGWHNDENIIAKDNLDRVYDRYGYRESLSEAEACTAESNDNNQLDEAKQSKLNKQEVLDWLSEHELAWEDFVNYFEDVYQSSAEVPMDEIIGWISDHDDLAEDFENKFGISVNADVCDDDCDWFEDELEEHVAIDVYDQLNSSNIIEIKPSKLKESIDNKWNIGSNKLIATDSQEFANLVDLAKLLQEKSPNKYQYTVKKTYEDFGAGMQWYNIICNDRKGDSWQVLNTKQWLDLANTGDIESVYQDIVSNNYFQDTAEKGSIFSKLDGFDE